MRNVEWNVINMVLGVEKGAGGTIKDHTSIPETHSVIDMKSLIATAQLYTRCAIMKIRKAEKVTEVT